MSKLSVLLWLVAATLVSAPVVAGTQTAASRSPAAEPQDETQIETLEVFLPVMVFDDDDKFVPGLVRENFRIFEDGSEQRIEQFEAPSKLPLSVAILMDSSSSVKRKLKFQKDAAVDFIQTIVKVSGDRALFATFDSVVTLRSDFTRDTGELTRAVDAVKAGGDTRMFDAVYRVCEEKMALLPAEQRAVMLVVTDGADTASDRSLEEAIEVAQRSNVTIFGISTRNYADINAGTVRGSVDKELARLCEDTGGRAFLPYQQLELARAFSNIASVLRNQYVLYYTPKRQERDGKFRKLKVDVVNAGRKVKVTAKKGYFAVPPGENDVPQ
jgi:Ca-activated chloride channel family protein